ncbi:hypothetical protein KR009_004641 [Drosophila setifemur]|nr:hypothetical protein KR009_004641 [Drosophila setifemur]
MEQKHRRCCSKRFASTSMKITPTNPGCSCSPNCNQGTPDPRVVAAARPDYKPPVLFTLPFAGHRRKIFKFFKGIPGHLSFGYCQKKKGKIKRDEKNNMRTQSERIGDLHESESKDFAASQLQSYLECPNRCEPEECKAEEEPSPLECNSENCSANDFSKKPNPLKCDLDNCSDNTFSKASAPSSCYSNDGDVEATCPYRRDKSPCTLECYLSTGELPPPDTKPPASYCPPAPPAPPPPPLVPPCLKDGQKGTPQHVQILIDMIRSELTTAPDFIYFDAKWRIIAILKEVHHKQLVREKGTPINRPKPNPKKKCDFREPPRKMEDKELPRIRGSHCAYCSRPPS